MKLERKKRICLEPIKNVEEQNNNNSTESFSQNSQIRQNKVQISKPEFAELLKRIVAKDQQQNDATLLSEKQLGDFFAGQEKGEFSTTPPASTPPLPFTPLQSTTPDAVQNSVNYVQNGISELNQSNNQQLVQNVQQQVNNIDGDGNKMLNRDIDDDDDNEAAWGSDDDEQEGQKLVQHQRQTQLQSHRDDSGNIEEDTLEDKVLKSDGQQQQVGQLTEAEKNILTNVVSNLQQGVLSQENRGVFSKQKMDQNNAVINRNGQQQILKDLRVQMQVQNQQIKAINSQMSVLSTQMSVLSTQMQTLEFSQQTLEEKIIALEESLNQ
eukprot:TRINITY_DN5688_c0_g3_i1.p1 TRINITY_DN5688_c0_g3~~TRINITY_DN5688_c0_g3_i1.p1  ORF type:complete len:338 (-),score=61.20 TRINITY_DN5688_c0_g3_i1:302-1273(-)